MEKEFISLIFLIIAGIMEVQKVIEQIKIPKVGDTFTLIASSIYYNKDGFKKVNDWRYV